MYYIADIIGISNNIFLNITKFYIFNNFLNFDLLH